MSGRGGAVHDALVLLRLDGRRSAAAVRRPRPGVWLSLLLPLLLLGGALGAAGPAALPEVTAAGGAVALGFLVSAPLAFAAYGVLFRPADDPFQRRLGLAPGALYLVRALRLLGLALGVALVLLLPFLVGGGPLARAAAVLLGPALAAWGAALLAYAEAARQTAAAGRRPGVFSRLMALDRELLRVGPLVYAPLAPLAAGLLAGGWIGAAPGAGWGRALAALGLGAALAWGAARPFARALPRFAPRALEMAFSPPPPAGETGLALGRGAARLLPRRVQAVRARDAVVAGRRFRWATSIVWPVAIGSVIALARWNELTAVRGWVLAAGALTLAAQGAAVIGLGRLERAGPRWIDHAAGLRPAERWAGRCAFGFGLTLWLTVPLALAWAVWAPVGSGWYWLAGGAAVAVVAAGASLAAAGR